jgi:diaminopimelate decarboxylase
MPALGFTYRGDKLHCEDVPLVDVAARCGTPCYVYSATSIVSNYRSYTEALAGLPHEIHYAVKANGSIGILSLLARQEAGFDIVSGGELFRVIRAGGDPSRVVFSGVGKTASEIEFALRSKIGHFNCESEPELHLLHEIAERLDETPSVALRVNPDINAVTHPYIATGLRDHKFGIALEQAEEIYLRRGFFPRLRFEGVSCHIGSQILDTAVFLDALEKVVALARKLCQAGVPIRHLDLGGGLGVAYRSGEKAPSVSEYAGALAEALRGKNLRLMLEPGRSIVGQAGVLLTKVLYRKAGKDKEFVIVDAAMNDLIRPALYQSYHEILPAQRSGGASMRADIVGPVCETGDFLARDRDIQEVEQGDLLAVCTAGAYGFVQASNYNARPRSAEAMVEGAEVHVIRDRESYEDLIRGERIFESGRGPARDD